MRSAINLLYPPRTLTASTASFPEEVLDVSPYNLFQFFIRTSDLTDEGTLTIETSMNRYGGEDEWFDLAEIPVTTTGAVPLVVPHVSGSTTAVLRYLRWSWTADDPSSKVTVEITGMGDHL